mgnify:CR=1 FL=1
MAKIYPCETTESDTGALVIEFPSGTRKSVAWRSPKPIVPTLDAAKQYAAKVIESMSAERRIDDLERTNWPSCVAAFQRIIDDWNQRVTRDAPAVQ